MESDDSGETMFSTLSARIAIGLIISRMGEVPMPCESYRGTNHFRKYLLRESPSVNSRANGDGVIAELVDWERGWRL